MLLFGVGGLLAAVPSSTNFTLKAYEFGNGAGAPSSSNYQLQASAGAAGGQLSSGSYGLPAGIRASATVGTPGAPTFANPDSSYSRLKVTLNASGFASDTKYLIAISDDNFVSTKYVQIDQTIGTSVGVGNYQTYAAWGGASGFWVLGLNQGTTYTVKVAALQGAATGSGFGPTATAATVTPSVTFAVSTSLTSTPPFAVAFSSLPPAQVTSGNATVTADITTNAQNGGSLLLRDQNSGLTSALSSYTLTSATADLTAASKGYGAQVTSASQLTAANPYNGTSDNVGALTTTWQQLANFSNPITAGNLTLALKAKTDAAVPPATDYADVLTISLSLLF